MTRVDVISHRWLSRLSMAVVGYLEPEKIRQEQGEISHRLTIVRCSAKEDASVTGRCSEMIENC